MDFLTRVAEAKNMRPEDFETAGNAEGNKISGKDVFQWLEDGDEAVMIKSVLAINGDLLLIFVLNKQYF